MDKADIILEKLQSLERIEADVRAIKSDNRSIHDKLDKLAERTEQTWMAVKELRDDKTELNELRQRIAKLEEEFKKKVG